MMQLLYALCKKSAFFNGAVVIMQLKLFSAAMLDVLGTSSWSWGGGPSLGWLFSFSLFLGVCVGYLMPCGLVFVALARDNNGLSVNCPTDHSKSNSSKPKKSSLTMISADWAIVVSLPCHGDGWCWCQIVCVSPRRSSDCHTRMFLVSEFVVCSVF